MGSNALYLIGWVITMVGLAVSQNWCEDHADLPLASAHTFLSHEVGKDCKTLLRFPWFIWVLGALPVLLSVGHLLKPCIFRRGSSALFAVLAVLHMIAAETFHDISRTDLADKYKRVEQGSKICSVGFALMAAMSLFLIIFESFLGDHLKREHVTTAGSKEAGGRVVTNPEAGEVSKV